MDDSIPKLRSCQVATERKKGHVLLKLHPAIQEAWWPRRFPKPVGQPYKQTLHLHLLKQQSELDPTPNLGMDRPQEATKGEPNHTQMYVRSIGGILYFLLGS